MLHYVMFEHCTTAVWTHLPLAGLERTALLPHFWEKPGWKEEKRTSRELLHHMHMGGHCVCVWTGLTHVCVCAPRNLCEVVGSVVRNGPIGQRLQETQHWHGRRILGVLDLLVLTDDDRRTHFCGSLRRQHMEHQMKVTIRSSNTHTGCLAWLRETLFFQSSTLRGAILCGVLSSCLHFLLFLYPPPTSKAPF